MNVFKGARRLSAVVGCVWIIGCITHVLVREHSGNLMYVVPAPGEALVSGSKCLPEDALDYTRAHFGDGDVVNITLCYAAHDSSDGRRLIPYALKTVSVRFSNGTVVDEIPEGMTQRELEQFLKEAGYDTKTLLGELYLKDPPKQTPPPKKLRYYVMNEKFSPEVTAYMARVRGAFMLPPEDAAAAAEANRSARLVAYKESAIVAISGLGAAWLFMLATGWIVRGFLNIPRGRDEAA